MMPRMLCSKAWNWGAKPGFARAHFHLHEPSYAELDVPFECKVSARKCASTNVEEFLKEGTEPVTVTPTRSTSTGKEIHTKHHEERK